MLSIKGRGAGLLIIIFCGLIPAVISQFSVEKPVRREIHIRNFRYGKDPSVIRCNRGDTLILSFSSDDTGHSFYLEEFDVDAKVSPSASEVTIFSVSDPTREPVISKNLTIIARHPGIYNYFVSRSNYRCHVWCGPMHAFEQGKLVIFPNTLLVFALGCLAGIFLIWLRKIMIAEAADTDLSPGTGRRDLFARYQWLRKIAVSRWPQLILMILALLMIYVVILTSVFGTRVSGRNLGVLLMWAVWLFVLVAVMTPFFGRFWCTICPLPLIGDWLQRGSFLTPDAGPTKGYNNKLRGLFLKWPHFLRNDWLKLIIFMIMATFSTTLVATPKISGITVLMLLIVPSVLSLVFELRAFCSYLCPVSVFVGPFSRMSPVTVGPASSQVCSKCTQKFCLKGSRNGWACPYGLNAGELSDNSECGMCLECTRSCMYGNVTLYSRPFADELSTRTLAQAWLSTAVFSLSVVYSVLYLGHWPLVRDYVNILDKGNWDLFGIYAVISWVLVLGIVPGILWLLAMVAKKGAETLPVSSLFKLMAGALIPLGLFLWIAFVIPMFTVNVTFILQSLSDPFGWGWDFLGTANTPWHQVLPMFTPVFQVLAILAGYYLSLRNLWRSLHVDGSDKLNTALRLIPGALFLTAVAAGMLFFFAN